MCPKGTISHHCRDHKWRFHCPYQLSYVGGYPQIPNIVSKPYIRTFRLDKHAL